MNKSSGNTSLAQQITWFLPSKTWMIAILFRFYPCSKVKYLFTEETKTMQIENPTKN